MRRRDFLALLSGATGWPSASLAQGRAQKLPRIGYLAGGSPSGMAPFVRAFQEGLREFGWVEDQNILIEYRSAEGRGDLLPQLAAELVELKVDVIFAAPTAAAVAAKRATTSIPVVFANVGDPVGLGLVGSLARPGANVTGIAYSVGLDLFGKQLEILSGTIPELRPALVLSNPANPAHGLAMRSVKLAGESLGMELQFFEARSPDQFNGVFDAMAALSAKAVLVLADTIFVLHRERIARLALEKRLASMHGIRENVEAGGLMFYGHDAHDLFRRAAGYVDKVLKGVAPADLPIEQPSKFEFVINLKTARALGIAFPLPIIALADSVID